MTVRRLFLCTLLSLSVSGCMQTQTSYMSSKSAVVEEASAAGREALIADQAAALNQMTQDIVRKSTVRGAAIGALAGCGLVVLSASNAKNCLTGAVAGGAVGAIIGNASGQSDVKRRVKLVSPSALVKSIGRGQDQLAQIEMDLPALLAKQDQELVQMNEDLKAGKITEAALVARTNEIRESRGNLANALTLSAEQSHEALLHMEAAKAKGQDGLDWHMNAAKNMSRDAVSARSTISML
jgi:uncharacterized protein YcfJ